MSKSYENIEIKNEYIFICKELTRLKNEKVRKGSNLN